MADTNTVIPALTKVMADLPAIGKTDRNKDQGFSYRGIETITAHLQPILARHGVVIVPTVESMETRDLTINNRPWTDTILRVNYSIYGPGGDRIEAVTVGIGRDNSDKGANKAMSQAFKYLLTQLLCIADAKDDGDAETHVGDDLDARPRTVVPNVERSDPRALALSVRAKALPEARQAEVRDWFAAMEASWPMPLPVFAAYEAAVTEIEIRP